MILDQQKVTARHPRVSVPVNQLQFPSVEQPGSVELRKTTSDSWQAVARRSRVAGVAHAVCGVMLMPKAPATHVDPPIRRPDALTSAPSFVQVSITAATPFQSCRLVPGHSGRFPSQPHPGLYPPARDRGLLGTDSNGKPGASLQFGNLEPSSCQSQEPTTGLLDRAPAVFLPGFYPFGSQPGIAAARTFLFFPFSRFIGLVSRGTALFCLSEGTDHCVYQLLVSHMSRRQRRPPSV